LLHTAYPSPFRPMPTQNSTSLCRYKTTRPYAIPLPLFAIRIHNKTPHRVAVTMQCRTHLCHNCSFLRMTLPKHLFALPQLHSTSPRYSFTVSASLRPNNAPLLIATTQPCDSLPLRDWSLLLRNLAFPCHYRACLLPSLTNTVPLISLPLPLTSFPNNARTMLHRTLP
jgi:hypothetical protein